MARALPRPEQQRPPQNSTEYDIASLVDWIARKSSVRLGYRSSGRIQISRVLLEDSSPTHSLTDKIIVQLMKKGVKILLAGGIVGILIGVLLGGLSTGYSLRREGFLIRAGVIYVLFAVVLWRVGLCGIKGALGTTFGAFLTLYTAGIVLMYYDLVITPSEFATQPSTSTLLKTQIEYSLVLAPVSTGYLAGVLLRQEGRRMKLTGVGVPLFIGVFGWLLASSLAMTTPPHFVFLVFALFAGAGIVAAVGPILVILYGQVA